MNEETPMPETPATGSNSSPSMNYLVVGVVVLVLLVGGLAFAFKDQVKKVLMPGQQEAAQVEQTGNETPPPPPPPSVAPNTETAQEVLVEYLAAGFSPASVTVKKGTTIKFVNNSGGPMSVASNPHPTHTDYSSFDQWKSDAKGQAEYDFTFAKVGTWGYHNHAKASDTGTVIVTE